MTKPLIVRVPVKVEVSGYVTVQTPDNSSDAVYDAVVYRKGKDSHQWVLDNLEDAEVIDLDCDADNADILDQDAARRVLRGED